MDGRREDEDRSSSSCALPRSRSTALAVSHGPAATGRRPMNISLKVVVLIVAFVIARRALLTFTPKSDQLPH